MQYAKQICHTRSYAASLIKWGIGRPMLPRTKKGVLSRRPIRRTASDLTYACPGSTRTTDDRSPGCLPACCNSSDPALLCKAARRYCASLSQSRRKLTAPLQLDDTQIFALWRGNKTKLVIEAPHSLLELTGCTLRQRGSQDGYLTQSSQRL